MTTKKWITKGKGEDSKHIPISERKPVREVNLPSIEIRPRDLEKEAWDILGSLEKISNIDELMLRLKRYSGTLGDYSAFNSLLIMMQNGDATIVRSRDEWKYFGRIVNDDASPISVLYPLGVPRKDSPGKVKEFIEAKRKEGLSDDAIDLLVNEKFDMKGGNTAFVFSTGKVYDISQTSTIPGKAKPVTEDIKATNLYNTLKKIAKEHYVVEEGTIPTGALGYTAHSGEGQKLKVMKIPGENVSALHTLIHEMSHARLEHLYREKNGLSYGLGESEAELSTYLVGQHFGFNFQEDSSAYIKGWLSQSETKNKQGFGKENLDRVMNNARWLINEISGRL